VSYDFFIAGWFKFAATRVTQVALFLGAKIREASSCRPREQDGCTWQSACQFFGLVASGQDLQCWFPCSIVVSD